METAIQSDMFQVTAFDPPLRDNRDVMEYPFLAIQKGRRKPIEYTSPDGQIRIEVSAEPRFGIANIWDWDLIIYLSSHINDALENKVQPGEWIEFAPYDALRFMKRHPGGRQYRELSQSIRRLFATNIITSIRTEDTEGSEGGNRWIQSYKIPRKFAPNKFIREMNHDGEPDGGQPWRIQLSTWLHKAICRRTGILAVHQDYFNITGGLERWLYRLCRKAVPDKADFPIINFRMETLHKRSGSTRPLRNFAIDIRRIAEEDKLPEYSVEIRKDGRHELVSLIRNRSKSPRLPRGLKLKAIEG